MYTNYKKVRRFIETGDVFFTSSPALFSRLIRLFRHARVSHTGVFVVLSGRVFTVECLEGKGCIMRPASERLTGAYWILKGKRVKPEVILKDVGKIKYDLFGALISPFYQNSKAKLFCSEAVAKWLNVKLPQLKRGITPDDLFTYFL